MKVPYQHDPIATALARKHGLRLLRLSAKLASRAHVFIARAANMKRPYQHDPIATAVARRHGPKLRRTNKELANQARVSVARAANMKRPYQHDPIATAVARKCGPKLLRTNEELASRAHVFAASVYWDPVHKCYRVAAQLPKGETAPNLNELVADALAGRLPSEHAEPVPGLSQESLASSPNSGSDGLRGQNNEMREG